MKKNRKKFYMGIALSIALMLVSIGAIITMSATQPQEGGHPLIINVLGIAGFFIPMGLAIFILIRISVKNMVVVMLTSELKELKRCKDYYFGSIEADSPQKYLNKIVADFLKARYKDFTSEINLNYDNYRFLLRKHFWKLDSTNYHIHIATVNADNFEIEAYFDDVVNREIELNYGKFKGSYCSIVAVCIVDELNENEEFLSLFHNIFFAREIAVVKVLIDVRQNRVFISRGGALTGSRGKQIVKRFILRTKSLKKHPGSFERNNEQIKELEEKIKNLDFNNLFKTVELSNEEKAFAASLRDGEIAFQETAEAKDGGIIFYKEGNKILYLFCDYNENDKTFGIIDIKRMKWNIPKKIRISRKHKQVIKEKIIQYLDKNNIPYTFIEIFFSQKNQTVLVSRNKK